MTTYRLRRECLSEALQQNRRRLLRSLPIMLIAVVGGLFVGSLTAPDLSPTMMGVLGVMVTGVVAFSLRNQLRQSEAQLARHFDSYVLEVSEAGLSHRSAILPELRLGRGEVTHIEESPVIGLLVRGSSPGKAAALSPFLEGYAELRGELSAWKPIAPVSQAQVGRRMDAAGLLGLVLGLGICLLWMGVGYFSDLRWAMLSGAVMLACGVAGLLYLRRSAPQLRLKPLISALVFFSLAIPARLFVHFYWPK